MPEIIAPSTPAPTSPVPSSEPTGSPFAPGEAKAHAELSPAELGLDIKVDVPDPTRPPPNPSTPAQPTPPNQPDDVIGRALKRGRPARDLSDLDDSERELFQNMSLEAYNKLYPFYKQFRGKDKELAEMDNLRKELDSLRKNPPAPSYYDHEDAYLLQQDYREALVEASNYDRAANHWKQQYINARSGKPIHDLIVGQDGQFQLGPALQPTPEAEAQIFQLMASAQQQATAIQSRLQSIRAEHSQRFTDYKTKMSEAYDKLIGPYKDQLKPLIDKNIQMFPEFVRGRQETQAIAALYSLLQHVIADDKAARQSQQAATINKNGAISAGPTTKSIATAPKGSNNLTNPEEEKAIRLQFGI